MNDIQIDNDTKEMLIYCLISDGEVKDYAVNKAFCEHFQVAKEDPLSEKYFRTKDKNSILSCAFYKGKINLIHKVNHQHYFLETTYIKKSNISIIVVTDITSEITKRKAKNKNYFFVWQK